MGEHAFTPKQEAFIAWYCRLLNATSAAERAGYGGDDTTRESLGSMGAALLQNVAVRAEIDRRLKASIPSPEEVLSRVGARATVDIGEYYGADGTLDLARLKADGYGHLVKGANVGRDGVNWALTDPQTATKTLARYHRLLGDRLEVDLTTSVDIDKGSLDALAAQLRAAASADSVTPDSVGDDDSA